MNGYFIFKENNNIPYWIDRFRYENIPHNIAFKVFRKDNRITLRAKGYGEYGPGNYGNGEIIVILISINNESIKEGLIHEAEYNDRRLHHPSAY
jgi:hypothetical protein